MLSTATMLHMRTHLPLGNLLTYQSRMHHSSASYLDTGRHGSDGTGCDTYLHSRVFFCFFGTAGLVERQDKKA